MSIVHTITSGKIHPIGNLIAQTDIKHITALLVRCDVAISSPVRILRTIGCIGNRPILYRNIAALIITLESLDIVEVFSTGEKGKKFKPCLDVDEVENAIYSRDLTDVIDILKEMMKTEQETQKEE